MRLDTVNAPDPDPVIQFSIFAENRIGRLNEVMTLLANDEISIAALATFDMTDIAVMRVVVNYPESARKTLSRMGLFFEEHPVLAMEIDSEADLKTVTGSLMGAEINIYYIYPMMMRPHGKIGLILSTEDPLLSTQVLECQGYRTLCQADIAR